MNELSREHAFKILGIEPTSDGRAIRNAFVRLARIYHPDRFAGMSTDVRAEAERRMKEATTAYESLRSRGKTVKLPPAARPVHGKDAWEDARRWREQIEARRREDEQDRARWHLWDELEREARQRAEWEAELAAKLAGDLGGVYRPSPSPSPSSSPSQSSPSPAPAPPRSVPAEPHPKSLLAQRLEAARNGYGNGNALAHPEPQPRAR